MGSAEFVRKGDVIWINGINPENGEPVYALVEYIGRTRDKGYKFESATYGWTWFVDREKTYIYHELSPEKHYLIDNSTGWLRYLPV